VAFRAQEYGLPRYIATVETAKHRVFQFLDANILPDNRLVCFGFADAYNLGVLSSRIHVVWTLANGGTLEDRPIYTKVRCFDPFPFPDPPEALKARIRATAEELDALRKQVQAERPGLTLTQLYNVLEKIRAGEKLDAREEAIKTNGLVLVLKEHHDKLDRLVAEAYGWPQNLSDDEILAKLAALNAERAAEEKRGLVHWLRPYYQRARAGVAPEQRTEEVGEQLEAPLVIAAAKAQKPAFPASDLERTAAVFAALVRLLTSALPSMAGDWVPILSALAVLTMTVGNIIALVQTNIKRMLAYSAIAHAGYVIVGMAAGGGHDAGGAILYYLLAYAFTNLGAFAVVVALERGAEAHDEISDYRGLAREHPGLAAAMALCLLSLTGVPPLAGFVAKFYIFAAALNAGLVWLVIIAVLNSVVSAYYYVGVIVAMYMQEGGVTVERMSRRPGLLISIGVGVAGVIALGIYPQPYMGAAVNAFASALGRQPIHTVSMLP